MRQYYLELFLVDSASEGDGEEEGSVVELDQETSELHNVEDEEVEEAGEEAGGSTGAQPTAEKDEDDDEPEDGPGTRYVIYHAPDKLQSKVQSNVYRGHPRVSKSQYCLAVLWRWLQYRWWCKCMQSSVM